MPEVGCEQVQKIEKYLEKKKCLKIIYCKKNFLDNFTALRVVYPLNRPPPPFIDMVLDVFINR